MDLEYRRSTLPRAIQIVDLYHARQHLWGLARKLYPNQQAGQERWMLIHKDTLLDEGKIEELVASLRSIQSAIPELAEKIKRSASGEITLRKTLSVCATPHSARSICSSALA
jgi:hypothetical protein